MDPEALTPQLIYSGYCQGYFPMTEEDGSVGWFASFERCLFPMTGIRVSRSLARRIRQGEYRVTFDTAFESVIRGCMRPTDNWISERFVEVYTEVHRQGWGHSCECWAGDELVGGVYGVALGSCFCAESMFHRQTDASKVALWALVQECARRGFTIFDAQIMNPHLKSLGAFEMPAQEYDALLLKALRDPLKWGSCPYDCE